MQAYWNSLDSFVYLGNSVANYLTAAVVFLALLIVFYNAQRIILTRFRKAAERTKTDIDDLAIDIFASIRPPFYFLLSLYLSLYLISIPNIGRDAVRILLLVWIVYQAVLMTQIIINFAVRRHFHGEEDDAAKSAAGFIGNIAKGVLWFIGFLLVLSNLGVNITSLVAGLGIGGIAIAFALQNILSDLFSSFAIRFDKPFRVGDFIIVGEHMGTVVRIGVKTTRIQALQGEEIIISNRELTSTRVQNFKRMKERRVVFALGVTYQTPREKMEKIPQVIRGIIEGIETVRFDRSHWKSFGGSSLDIETVYYILSGDYNLYMDIQQEINLKIYEAFENEGIAFAYPTQTVYLAK